jgi:orotidine-5'-phosphate decarboxylase
MSVVTPEDRLIVALDGMTPEKALGFVSSIPDLRWVKVGLELFTAAGSTIVAQLRDCGLHVFLDLKFHDIPATMAGACRSAARLGAELITVHASSGQEGLARALEGARQGAEVCGLPAPTLLAVTVLTSWSKDRLASELQIQAPMQSYVEHLALLAAKSGIGGCVCSPHEVAGLRCHLPEPFMLVTPGIRPLGSDRGDQARVMTPVEAVQAGASRLVLGRPITAAHDPVAAFKSCCQDLVVTPP